MKDLLAAVSDPPEPVPPRVNLMMYTGNGEPLPGSVTFKPKE
jgi:hypothetical protein